MKIVQMLRYGAGLAAGLFALSGVASAATVVTATFTGTVNFAYNPSGGLPSASDGDTLVATYVFDLDQSTQSLITSTGGYSYGPYGTFASASVSINGVAGALPAFTSGELTGETQVFATGSVIDGVANGASGAHIDSNLTGFDFAWNLSTPATGFSYTTSNTDQSLIQVEDTNGDLLESDISQVDIVVSSTSSVPEPSSWALMLIGVAGIGYMSRRASRTAAMAAV